MIRIAITGPESSGKTTLSKKLSSILKAYYVEEFARTFLEQRLPNPKYTLDDLIFIANKQFEYNAINPNEYDFLICDTEMTVIKIWSEDKFNIVPEAILNLYHAQNFDIYLLCVPDIEWKFDQLREDSNRRTHLFAEYHKNLEQMRRNFHPISGSIDKRIQQSLEIIHGFKKV